MKQKIQYLRKNFEQRLKRCLYISMLCTLCCTAFFACSREDDVVLQAELDDRDSGQEETALLPEADDLQDRDSENGKTTESPAENPVGNSSVNPADHLSQDDGKEAASVCVYVCGCVKNPGVYNLEQGARICDAVAAAGGLTKDAAEDYWNLAEILSDGDMIYFPSKSEADSREAQNASAKDYSLASASESNVRALNTADSSSTAEPENALININTANAEELMRLPGIGEARSAMIISYRNDHGSFAVPSDIKKVSGIGDALFDKIKNMITVN